MSLYIIGGVRKYSNITTSVRRWSGVPARAMPIAEFLQPLDRNPASIDDLSCDFVRSCRQIQKAPARPLEIAL